MTPVSVPQDYAEAARWYRTAAEQGHAAAQFSLGVMYSNGEGVPQDLVQGYAWASVAAAQGFESASRSRDLAAALQPIVAEVSGLEGRRPRTTSRARQALAAGISIGAGLGAAGDTLQGAATIPEASTSGATEGKTSDSTQPVRPDSWDALWIPLVQGICVRRFAQSCSPTWWIRPG